MAIKNTIDLPKGCAIVDMPTATDERGKLTFAQSGREIPFAVERVFWIYDVPEHQKRGGHAHRSCAELVVAARGSFTMRVDDGQRREDVKMSDPEKGILIPSGVWCELTDFEPGTILIVMASEVFDAAGYVHNYEDYIKEKGV